MEFIHIYMLIGVIFLCLLMMVITLVTTKETTLKIQKDDFITAFIKEKERQLERSKTGVTLKTYILSLFVCPTALCVAVVYMMPTKPMMVFPAIIGGAFLPRLYIQSKKNQQDKLFPDRFAKALSQMSSSLNAGRSFEQAIDSVVENELLSDSIREDFRVLSAKIKLGTSIPKAFEEYAEFTKDDDVKDTAVTISIMMDVGKDEALAIKEIQKSIEDRLLYRKKRASMMTESKIMIQFGDWIPILTVGGLYILAPGMLSAYFESGTMMLIFFALIGMMLLGSVITHKLIVQKKDIS